MLQRQRPLDVLVSNGRSKAGRAFFSLLQMKKGPFFRDSDYILVDRKEREHFPWVMAQLRTKAPEFFMQRPGEMRSWSCRGIFMSYLYVYQCISYVINICIDVCGPGTTAVGCYSPPL